MEDKKRPDSNGAYAKILGALNFNDTEKWLFWINFVTITVLAILFTLEALMLTAHPITGEIVHIFMGLLATYVVMKRAGRWGQEKEDVRKGEWVAILFILYIVLVIAPVHLMRAPSVWPATVMVAALEMLGLLGGDTIVKTVNKNRCAKRQASENEHPVASE